MSRDQVKERRGALQAERTAYVSVSGGNIVYMSLRRAKEMEV